MEAMHIFLFCGSHEPWLLYKNMECSGSVVEHLETEGSQVQASSGTLLVVLEQGTFILHVA